MSCLSFKNFCAVFIALAFAFTVIGSPADAQAQSQEKLEKANSISNALIVGALVLVAVAVIVTVTKGDKKHKDDTEKNDSEEGNEQQLQEGQAWVEPASLNSQVFALRHCEAERLSWKAKNAPAAFIEGAHAPQGCLMFAYEME